MGIRLLLALCAILLALGCAVQATPVPAQDEPALMEKVQKSLYEYWDSAKAAAQGLYHNSYLASVDEKIRDMYTKGTAAMTTYAGIFTDQILSLLKGDA
ncbi:apolipoprotein C-II [Ochotona curzoniae]|uniref:apolipoprotein C-II n=1 Tax=Ochotona curzoniae TaxID=130825 RepID=UPI001B3501D7|nr:apolipoprotein C-II [Ochotona curzoniae]